MGQFSSTESLVLRWAELCADSRWDDFAGKIELNGYGVIEMSPASNPHGIAQLRIGSTIERQLPNGTAMVECSVLTDDGIRVPDVAWASAAFMARHGTVTPFPAAPEICVEVRSPSNTDAEMAHKVELFLAAGAVEVWIVSEAGDWQIHAAEGQREVSQFGVQLQLADRS
jgi:Uma2 family endonuclease